MRLGRVDAYPQVPEAWHVAQRPADGLPVLAEVGGPDDGAAKVEPDLAGPVEVYRADQVRVRAGNPLQEEVEDDEVVEVESRLGVEEGDGFGVTFVSLSASRSLKGW